jgi:ribosomal protein L28
MAWNSHACMQRRRRKLSINVHTRAMLKIDHRKKWTRYKVSTQHIKGVSSKLTYFGRTFLRLNCIDIEKNLYLNLDIWLAVQHSLKHVEEFNLM